MFFRKPEPKRFVRVQTTGPTVEGVLVARNPDHYRLISAKHILSEEQSVTLDGEIEVPRERVLFIQILGESL